MDLDSMFIQAVLCLFNTSVLSSLFYLLDFVNRCTEHTRKGLPSLLSFQFLGQLDSCVEVGEGPTGALGSSGLSRPHTASRTRGRSGRFGLLPVSHIWESILLFYFLVIEGRSLNPETPTCISLWYQLLIAMETFSKMPDYLGQIILLEGFPEWSLVW